jgi:uncharacterized protein YecT (DUF1311 family)
MKVFLCLNLVLLTAMANAQSSAVDIYTKHHFPCDSGGTTLEVNLCSGEKADFADNLLNKLYKKILNHIDKEIKRYTGKISTKVNPALDSSEIKFAMNEKSYYVRLRQRLVTSQQQWLKFRSAHCDVESSQCEGGTACTALVNEAYVSETLDRIRQLEGYGILD